jgi:hypothetical protein
VDIIRNSLWCKNFQRKLIKGAFSILTISLAEAKTLVVNQSNGSTNGFTHTSTTQIGMTLFIFISEQTDE